MNLEPGRTFLHYDMRRLIVALACLMVCTVLAQEGPPPMLVVASPVTEESVAEKVDLLGTVRALLDSLVACEVDGRVAERRVEHGDRVARGTVLVQIDSTRLQKDLEAARSEQAEAQALLELAGRQEARAQELSRDNVLARGDLDAAVSRHQSLAGRVRAIDARVATIEHDIARTQVRAPFSGVVTELRTEIGEWIRQGDPVVRLSSLDTVEIRVDVPARYFPHLSPGEAAPATIEALSGLVLQGEIFAVVPRGDGAARTFPVLIRAENPEGRVAAGMLARVALTLGADQRELLVPKDAVVRQSQREVVFVIEDGVVRVVTVITGRARGEHVSVRGDLAAGDSVVVRGNERLQPGQEVRVDDPPDIAVDAATAP